MEMYLLLDTNDDALLERVYSQVNELDDSVVLEHSDETAVQYGVEHIHAHIVDRIEDIADIDYTSPVDRHHALALASKGVQVFSNTLDKENPLYAGPLPDTEDSIRRAIVTAKLAQTRAEFFAGFGVNYVGRVRLDPKTIVVLDNKKDNPTHSPAVSQELEALIGSMPTDWWGSCGLVSAGNVDKLEKFLENVPSAVFLTYTTGGQAKLKYTGLPFAMITPPREVSSEYGVSVRERANRLSYNLSLS